MRRVVVLSVVMLFVVGFTVAACGGGEEKEKAGGGTTEKSSEKGGVTEADAGQTKQLFVDNCGSCHKFGAAKTTGTTGPDLDAVKPDEEKILSQIENGGGGMPAALLKGVEAKEVAAYVADSAGK